MSHHRNDTRKFEVWKDGAWHPINYRHVAFGDVIRIFEADGTLHKGVRWYDAGACESDGTIPCTAPVEAWPECEDGPKDPGEYELLMRKRGLRTRP